MQVRSSACLLVLFGIASSPVIAQTYSPVLTMSCDPVCENEPIHCIAGFSHSGPTDDTWVVTAATAKLGSEGAPQADHPTIVAVSGNAVCHGPAGSCDPLVPEDCSLPCSIGPGGSALDGLPGLADPGVVLLLVDSHVAEAADPNPYFATVSMHWRNLCNGSNSDPGCYPLPQQSNISLGSMIVNCSTISSATCSTHADCNNGIACDGVEVCMAGHCAASLPSACRADLDANGVVDFQDLAMLLAVWGPCPDCPADLDCDALAGSSDLAEILQSWGPCLQEPNAP